MADTEAPRTDHVDVLIIGAGISGVGAAAHLAEGLPDRTYAILERRDAMGGTWDLFRYPGIRSDSDMHTLGFRKRPWPSDKVLADGPSIKRYVEETAAHYGITEHIRFGHRVTRAEWDSGTATWTVSYEANGPGAQPVAGRVTASFLWGCSGYYDYDQGYAPEFPGVENFSGQLVYPQFWPEDLDYAGKKVVVIGSGATAVTLVPAMADQTEHITMLQRSPTYILSIPSDDPMGAALRKVLPGDWAAGVSRWRNVLLQAGLYQAARRRPKLVRKVIRRATVAQLPKGYDVDTHFKPSYDPWDQRMCMVPNGDLFKAIRKDKASIATGHIETFTENGIRLTDGTELEADIVVSATGLNMQLMGGVEIVVDGRTSDPHDRIVYKGAMLDGVPNMVFVVGYTNASWTLKADLVSEYVVRLLKTMDRKHARIVVPVRADDVDAHPLMVLSAGYISRAVDHLPQAGSKKPWTMPNNYVLDIPRLRHGRVDDGVLEFSA